MSCEQETAVIPGSDGWADVGPREAQAHPGIHGSYHRHDVIEWFEPSTCEYTADHARPICPVGELASTDDGSPCRLICERIGVEDGSGAWRCPHHGYFRVFDYPSETERETKQATLLTDGGREQHTEGVIQESVLCSLSYSSEVVAPNPSTYVGSKSESSESGSESEVFTFSSIVKPNTVSEQADAPNSEIPGRWDMSTYSGISRIIATVRAGLSTVSTPKTSLGFSI